MNATCNSCAFTANVQRGSQPAVQHESDNPEHRVSVWDSSTSQIPRDCWTTVARA